MISSTNQRRLAAGLAIVVAASPMSYGASEGAAISGYIRPCGSTLFEAPATPPRRAIFESGDIAYRLNGSKTARDASLAGLFHAVGDAGDGRVYVWTSQRGEPYALLPRLYRDRALSITTAGAQIELRRGWGDIALVRTVLGSHDLVIVCRNRRAQHVTYDLAPRTIAGRAAVPLRLLAEALGARVAWHPQGAAPRGIVTVRYSATPTPTPTLKPRPSPTPPTPSPFPPCSLSVAPPSVSAHVGDTFTVTFRYDELGAPAPTIELVAANGAVAVLSPSPQASGAWTIDVQAIAPVDQAQINGHDPRKRCAEDATVNVTVEATPSPTPSPTPLPPPPDTHVELRTSAFSRVYNELSPGTQDSFNSVVVDGALDLPHAAPFVRLTGTYGQFSYRHPANRFIAFCPVTDDPGCVTLIGHETAEQRIGSGQFYIPPFAAVDHTFAATAGVRVARRLFVHAAYDVKQQGYLGYPILHAWGGGIERPVDGSRRSDLSFRLTYVPSLSGTYTFSCFPVPYLGCNRLAGTRMPFSYSALDYRVGGTINLSPNSQTAYIIIGASGDYGFSKRGAPGGFNHSRLELGLGVRVKSRATPKPP